MIENKRLVAEQSTQFAPEDLLPWPCDPLPFKVLCAAPALRRICAETAKGFRQLRHGGLEVGGILFGKRDQQSVTILGSRLIPCEHRFGPSFVLSDADKSLLERNLAAFRSDPQLGSLEPVGCYFSHARHGPELTPSDVELCNRYFGSPSQIALVLRPNSATSTQVSVFARGPSGVHVCYHQFEAVRQPEPNRKRSSVASAPPPSISQEPIPEDISPEMIPAEMEQAAFQAAVQPPPAVRGHVRIALRILLLAAPVLLVVLGLLNLGWIKTASTGSSAPIPLSVTGAGRDLSIRWVGAENATLGTLEIRDGRDQPVHLFVGPDQLQHGLMTYTRKSGKVEVRLTLFRDGRRIAEPSTATYVGPAGEGVAPIGNAAEDADVERNFPPQPPAAAPVERAPAAVTPAAAAPAPAPVPVRALRKFTAPAGSLTVPVAARSVPVVSPPPPLLQPPSIPNTTLSLLPPTLPSVNARALPPPPAVAKTEPKSGRLIWTGQLPSYASLLISGGTVSSGYINGSLPGIPLDIEARPAELVDGGIVVFTNNAKGRPETPGVENGWNNVFYKPEPRRASELHMLEAPGAGNKWSRLVLQNGGRSVSVIVMDWRSTAQ